MYRLWLILLLIGTVGCAATPWDWQDVRTPPRASSEADLAACRSYASAQYSPGIPAGDPYLKDHPLPEPLDQEMADIDPGTGIWHPDREPFPYTNRSRESIHGVVVPYTGYPGELDYHPDYLDALVEKCMADRGWAFRPVEYDPNK
ncbi:MAG: hypothetical protein NDI73_00265 [Desulfuromonadales bacterium]|nr:hypothetical protein [Desulfuromonadales bacterium]